MKDFHFMLNIDLGVYWTICWGAVVPVGLSAILAYSLVDFNLPTYNQQPLPQTAYGEETSSRA